VCRLVCRLVTGWWQAGVQARGGRIGVERQRQQRDGAEHRSHEKADQSWLPIEVGSKLNITASRFGRPPHLSPATWLKLVTPVQRV
jgi:hypothetical protein